jgi:hypothetical protein
MRKRTYYFGLVSILAIATVPLAASAKKEPPALPSCTGLAAAVQAIVPHTLPGTISGGIVGRTTTPFVSIVPAAPEVPASNNTPTPVGPTPAYCQVAFVYFPGGAGPDNPGPGVLPPGVPSPAYNAGETQAIEIQISLPLNSADGGAGGIEGNFAGGVITGGSPGSSGSLSWAAFEEGLDMGGPGYAIRQGFVASETDDGETAAALANSGGSNFAITPATSSIPNKIAYGVVADWIYRGTHYGKQWADEIAKVYYGKEPTIHYYDGCSGGGNMGMGQLQNYGDEYDGFLIGAPAYRWQQFRLADSWPALVMRKLVQLDGTAALLTAGQTSALNSAVLAACDVEGTDTVADGLIADPRVCTLNFSAQTQVCGEPTAPGAPNCLTTDQAAAMDRVWDGPRNSLGARLWYPYDISIPLGGGGFTGFSVSSINLTGSTVQVVQWDHANATWPANNCLFVDEQSLSLGTTNTGLPACASPGTPITYEQEQSVGSHGIDNYSDNEKTDLRLAVKHGTKVMQIRGTADPAIRWRHDVDYYNRVAVWYSGGTTEHDYKALQRWYRFYPAPSVGHCGGGAGPYWYDPFVALRKWVEHNIEPKYLVGLTGPSGIDPGRTRPICSFPHTAVYNGTGSTDDFNSFTCEGNLQTTPVACNDVKTVYGHETTGNLDFEGVGLKQQQCLGHLPPPHAGTPSTP